MHRYTELRTLQDRTLTGPPAHIRPPRAGTPAPASPCGTLRRLVAAIRTTRRDAPADAC